MWSFAFADVAYVIVATNLQQILLSSDKSAIFILLVSSRLTAIHCAGLLLADSALERSSELPI